jgi:hypothetical protein
VRHFLRRLFHRPPTVADCITAARRSPCEPLNAPDPYMGVVGGPRLVERTRAAHAAHVARWADDDGWAEVEWGTFSPEALGHDLPDAS